MAYIMTLRSFNYTFMELKWTLWLLILRIALRFNCTFMELKFVSSTIGRMIFIALIVPLWNWNPRSRCRHTCRWCALIVPLWNWNVDRSMSQAEIQKRFNCTFMELKCRSPESRRSSSAALIVPLWNWNWSINCWRMSSAVSFNCTFMELK